MRRLLLGLVLASSACDEGPFDPAIGPDREGIEDGDTCRLGDSDPAREVRFDQVRDQIFLTGCGCHTVRGGLGQVVGGLDLDTHAALLAGGRHGPVVVAGNPCESNLVRKASASPPFGARMPLNGTALPAGQRQLLVDWIVEGARP